jgi:hypothetical protein
MSPRAREAWYRECAAEFRALAEAKPVGPVQDRLIALAEEYERLAGMVERGETPERELAGLN